MKQGDLKLRGKRNSGVAVLGAGLAGLSAAFVLQHRGCRFALFEKSSYAGGLARTIEKNGFRFDLGGHRFVTPHEQLNQWIKKLLFKRYITVKRSSRIYMNGKMIHYPLRPLQALQHVGPVKTAEILRDYVVQKMRFKSAPVEDRSLESWVISQFGDTLYKLFFKGYSEKVWGLDCSQIDKDWISKRIQDLSLGDALREALLKIKSSMQTTLVDEFLYPINGIGELPRQLLQHIDGESVHLGASIECINHQDGKITGVQIKKNGKSNYINADDYISTIPLVSLLPLLRPLPPESVLQEVKLLRSRDLILVTLFANKTRITSDNWIYFPEKDIPFGRVHEPKNWSAAMAPSGKTALVTEHFCSRDDAVWRSSDSQLSRCTLDSLTAMKMVEPKDVIDVYVLRIKDAYPLFDLHYQRHRDAVFQYLDGFSNLSIAGRTGLFRYYNMDMALLSGMEAACNLVSQGAGNVSLQRFLTSSMHTLDNYNREIADEMRTGHSFLAA